MDPGSSTSFGLVPKDVIDAIRAAEPERRGRPGRHAAGAAGPDFQYTVDIQSRLNEPEAIRQHRRQRSDRAGRPAVQVRDVARIELGAQTYAQYFRVNGKPAAGIAIYQTPEANSLQVGKEVAEDGRSMVTAASRRACATRFPTTPRSSSANSINEVYKTLYQAGILVLIVILVFLQNFRATLVPATTVPVTIIGAFAGMAALGFTVNLSTLFGIVLAIGIVVDDAIVIVEGVTKYIERGMSATTPPSRPWANCSGRSSASPWC